MKKEYRISFTGLSAACILLGAVMVAWPDAARRAACIALGAVCALAGIIRLFYCWRGRTLHTPGGGTVLGAVLIITGLLAMFRSSVMMSAAVAAMGIAVIAGGVVNMQMAFALKRNAVPGWKAAAAIAAAVTAVGIMLLFDPLGGARAMTIASGILLMLSGIANGFMALRFKKLDGIMEP